MAPGATDATTFDWPPDREQDLVEVDWIVGGEAGTLEIRLDGGERNPCPSSGCATGSPIGSLIGSPIGGMIGAPLLLAGLLSRRRRQPRTDPRARGR